jgi:hypothetical protein
MTSQYRLISPYFASIENKKLNSDDEQYNQSQKHMLFLLQNFNSKTHKKKKEKKDGNKRYNVN